MINEMKVLNQISRELLKRDLDDLDAPTAAALMLALRAGQKIALATTAVALAHHARG